MRTSGSVLRWGSSLAASALLATLVAVVGLSGSTPVAPSAAGTLLCSGWSGCSSAGYSDAGYGAVSRTMYWNMYSGHNCTNYVAYRMIKAGMPNRRPWSGGGNASEWGLEMRSITDQTPNVGAVAWWGRYSNGSGSAGHVAYVEKVISSTEILISQDSWGGTFHWARLTKSSGRWPTGFIHFVDKRIMAKAKPSISGVLKVGQTLKAGAGLWAGAPTSYSYLWYAGGASTGVTTPTYTLRPQDIGKPVSVSVTAKRAGYLPGWQNTATTASVAPGDIVLGEQPEVSGEPYIDETLNATAGTWSPAPKRIGYRWYANGRRLAANTGKLPLTTDLVGKNVTLRIFARQTGYADALSPVINVGPVLAGDVVVTKPFTVSGVAERGQRLTITPGTFTPTDATVGYQWLRDGVAVPGATHASYRLSKDDVAHVMTVRVALTRKNYTPWSSTMAIGGLVRTQPDIKYTATGRPGAVKVRTRVVASGRPMVRGQVQIVVGGQKRTVNLWQGIAEVTFDDVRPGRRRVIIRYLGNGVVLPGSVHTAATVTKR